MYQGKHIKHGKPARKLRKSFILLVSLVLVLGLAIGGTIAYLITNTGPVKNVFTPGTVKAEIEESFDETKKENVKVTNTGDVDVYIRATYVINWVDADGKIVKDVPEGYSYTLNLNTKAWTEKNGIFYWNAVVKPDNSTGNLINSAVVTAQQNPEYFLQIDVLSDAIQASPASAVEEAWEMSFENGTWQQVKEG